MPLNLETNNIEEPGLEAAQKMKKPHRERDVEVEKIRDADDGEIDEYIQPHTIAKKQ